MSSKGTLQIVTMPEALEYVPALEWQRRLARARGDGELREDLLLLLEHPHVITLGRGARERNVISPPARLGDLGVEVHEIERGGDVTYHGPGQLVGYPILDLRRHKRDLHWYLRQVEAALIGALPEFGLRGERAEGYTGVWIQDRKIASIGVHVGRWVTWHGFALNVNTDLSYFDLIVPCGIQAVRMTSIEEETGRSVPVAAVAEAVGRSFAEVFELEARAVEPGAIPGFTEISRPGVPGARTGSSPAAPPSAS